MKFKFIQLMFMLIVVLITVLIISGCSSDDGDDIVLPTRVPSLIPTLTPEAISESTEITFDNGKVRFIVTDIEFWAFADSSNHTFTVVLGEFYNNSDESACISASDIRLYLDDAAYLSSDELMARVQNELQPPRDFAGANADQCIDASDSALTFAVFDAPPNVNKAEVAFSDERIELDDNWWDYGIGGITITINEQGRSDIMLTATQIVIINLTAEAMNTQVAATATAEAN